jgi:hypothetical protein
MNFTKQQMKWVALAETCKKYDITLEDLSAFVRFARGKQ